MRLLTISVLCAAAAAAASAQQSARGQTSLTLQVRPECRLEVTPARAGGSGSSGTLRFRHWVRTSREAGAGVIRLELPPGAPGPITYRVVPDGGGAGRAGTVNPGSSGELVVFGPNMRSPRAGGSGVVEWSSNTETPFQPDLRIECR